VWRTTVRYVKKPADYEPLMAYLRDAVVLDHTEPLLRDRCELGEDGVPLVALARTPFQQLWIEWVDIRDLCYHLADAPDILQECMELMGGVVRRIGEVACRAPADLVDFVDFPDNITAPVIGEANLRRWCAPFYNEMAQMLAERGVPVFVPMDGSLAPLYEAIGGSGVRGLDSLSPPPDNDTGPGRAHAMWPEMRLFVSFPSSVHLAPAERVYQRACELLEKAGHSGRLQIQVSEDVPPGAWRRSYPQVARACEEFGQPQTYAAPPRPSRQRESAPTAPRPSASPERCATASTPSAGPGNRGKRWPARGRTGSKASRGRTAPPPAGGRWPTSPCPPSREARERQPRAGSLSMSRQLLPCRMPTVKSTSGTLHRMRSQLKVCVCT